MPVVDAASASDAGLADRLAAADVIAFPGGDPDVIVAVMPGTAAWAAIAGANAAGAVLAGASAGAMALAPWTWTPGGGADGLGVVPGFVVVPHASEASWTSSLERFGAWAPAGVGAARGRGADRGDHPGPDGRPDRVAGRRGGRGPLAGGRWRVRRSCCGPATGSRRPAGTAGEDRPRLAARPERDVPQPRLVRGVPRTRPRRSSSDFAIGWRPSPSGSCRANWLDCSTTRAPRVGRFLGADPGGPRVRDERHDRLQRRPPVAPVRTGRRAPDGRPRVQRHDQRDARSCGPRWGAGRRRADPLPDRRAARSSSTRSSAPSRRGRGWSSSAT